MRNFNYESEASDWLMNEAVLGKDFIDNYRFAFQDDPKSMNDYHSALEEGCCGFFDEEIVVAGRPAKIGCNFGH